MIRLEGVTKTFAAGQRNEFSAVRGIDLSFPSSAVIAFKGSSGSGKTTLLSLIGCMTRPTSGRIWLDDREISGLPERFLCEIRRQRFGFMFQNFQLIAGVNVLENVMLPAVPTGRRYSEVRKAAARLLERFSLTSKAGELVQHLSGGEQQRTALARALINSPEIIIADEPTAHLDTGMSKVFLELVSLLRREGRSILMASHDPRVYEAAVVDRVVELADGKITGEGDFR